MLAALTILLVCQLIGEAIAVGLDLAVPGPVIGMVLLFAGLCIKKGIPQQIDQTGSFLLKHLSILFIPAGVGIMVHMGQLQNDLPMVILAVIGSTLAGILVTALVMTGLQKLQTKQSTTDSGDSA